MCICFSLNVKNGTKDIYILTQTDIYRDFNTLNKKVHTIKICIQSGEGFYMGYNILSRTISKVGHYSLNRNAHYPLYLHFKWKYKL